MNKALMTYWTRTLKDGVIFLLKRNCPLTNSCEEIGASDIDTFNATLKLDKNIKESSWSKETAKNNNNTNLCQEDSERSADVFFNDNDIIMAEEVIEVIIDQIIGDVIHAGQVQDSSSLQNQDYLCVNNDEQIKEDLNVENDIEDEESEFTIPEIAQEICHCHSSAQEKVFIFDESYVRNAIENSFLQDFANALAKEVIEDILVEPILLAVTPINHHEINQDRFSSNQHDTSNKADNATLTIFDTTDQDYTQRSGNLENINNHSITNFNEDSFNDPFHEVVNINDNAHLSEDEDELFLILEPPQQEMLQDEILDKLVDEDEQFERLNMLEKEVAHLQECVDLSEANAEAANMELVKETAKVESLQHELNEQMNMFNIKVV